MNSNVDDSSKIYSFLKKHHVTQLNYIIGTHAHKDHIGGLAGALNFASAKVVYCPVTSYDSKAFQNFQQAVENQGKKITVPQKGESFSLGDAMCKILAVNSDNDTNNTSIVLRITYGNISFLFTGDMEQNVEQAILSAGEAIQSSILKIGHHGSETSTSYVWLREVNPQYAVISVSKDNPYGHPSDEVLSRLRDADVTTFRTDIHGDIYCVSDGKTVEFTVSRNQNIDVFASVGPNSTQSTLSTEQTYVLNTNTKKFHDPNCRSVNQMKDKNKEYYTGSREELIERGYSPCGNCHP